MGPMFTAISSKGYMVWCVVISLISFFSNVFLFDVFSLRVMRKMLSVDTSSFIIGNNLSSLFEFVPLSAIILYVTFFPSSHTS